jgi:predicted dehydrogenase
MAGTARPAALAAAQRYGLEDVVDIDRLLGLPAVELVYISTPPFLHYEQARRALDAGKHVICEKPLALTVEQADELIALASRNDRLLVANLMQRYNAVFDLVKQVIDERPLGEILHGYFENYASDEHLSPEHWFWDRAKSGGIFIEHGVHFFDLVAGWLGPGEVVAAQASRRPVAAGVSDPGNICEDQVQCAVRYANGVHFNHVVRGSPDPAPTETYGRTSGEVRRPAPNGGVHFNFYHGFHQPGRLDRQELRLVFERGDVLLQGWVPTSVRIHAVADETQTRQLCELFPGARIDAVTTYSSRDRRFYAHGREHDVYQQFELTWGDWRQKMAVYCELLRRMMTDQLTWIRDRRHERKITQQNGRDSVALACAADRLARELRE